MKPRSHQRIPGPLFPQPTAASIAQRLRTLRHERGWSLADVEILSHGSIKAVVLGSYERCDRAMSLNRAIELAGLFSIPLAHLLCAPEEIPVAHPHSGITFDLRKVKSLDPDDQTSRAITAFIAWILGRRSDWNGEVLSLRQTDQSTLALMTFTTEPELLNWLKEKSLLLTGLNHP